jgi:hypothetical protein
VRETIVAAAKSNGSICRGRQTDILPEANPKGSICRGRKTHTHTYILAAAKQSLQSAEGERNSCLLLQQIKASICGDHSYEKRKIFPPVWRLDEILWSDPFAILQVAAAI